VSGVLDKAIVLSELGPDERSTLLDFLEPRQIQEGGALFYNGEESGEMYLVMEGSVRLEIDGSEAGVIGAGDALGAMSLVRIGSRQCGAVAVERCRVLVLTRASYLRLRAEFPAIALALQEGIVRYVSGELQSLLDRA